MAPRAYWKGYLKLSLVSCPIALFPATSEREKISFHQLNKKTGHRIKYRKVDAESGDEVDSADVIKGYEVGKGDYIELDPEELEAVAIESKRTIDIDEFVPRDEIDELYLNNPYYIAPDGEVGQQAFAVIREAIRKEGMVAIGKVVFTSREHIIALEPRGKGLLGVTLRYPYEVRKEDDYFDDIPDEKIPKDMLDLASHIVKTKGGTLNRASLKTSTKMRSRSCSKRSRRASQSNGQSNPSRQTWSISWMRFGAASRRAVRLHQARRRAARQPLAVHLKKPNIQSGKRRGVPDELSCRKTALNDAQHDETELPAASQGLLVRALSQWTQQLRLPVLQANGSSHRGTFCQFRRNCAFASSRLGARPLVTMPRLGLTYTVMDQNHRNSGLLCRSSYSRPTSRRSSTIT